ncbi:DEKNAAC103165 [Brettanomyces naardenensis]|uniref:beta-glucosidase n=1 Tax=Brettanomyces naardenensis TaxID=13370 RepID=A0A448YMJ3_BRENA|nr:DEKNAAC103165 [Brettanomyces naardenensis]
MTFEHFDVDKLLEELTLKEKVALIAGQDYYTTAPIERLNIPSIRVSDGPNGVRGKTFFDAVPSACFPNGTCLASSFNTQLLEESGELMSIEAEHKGVQAILGPTTNIQRGPLGARGFESFSEDPYLAGMSASSIISGIQKSGKVAATIKHFVCNDLDHERFASNSVVSERALREIYLEPFRWAVRLAQPKCFMASYNKVNGVHSSENPRLIQEVLRGEWNYNGLVMSDWFGVYSTVPSIKAGVDIEFPGPSKFRSWDVVRKSLESREGNLSVRDIDNCARHVLNLIKSVVEDGGYTAMPRTPDDLNNTPVTRAKLREIADEGIVLLRNQRKLLPLSKNDSIVIIGPGAAAKNAYSGGGSATLDTYYVATPLEGIKNKLGHDVDYTVGCYSHKTLSGLFEVMTNDYDKCKQGVKASFYLTSPEQRPKGEKPFDVRVVHNSTSNFFDYVNPAIKNPVSALFYVDFEGYFVPTETGDYKFGCQAFGTAMVYLDGKLMIDNKTHQRMAATGYGSVEETGIAYLKADQKYKIKIQFGSDLTSKLSESFGSGSLQVGVIKVIDEDEEIRHAVELAKSHDKVILCIGLNNQWETEGFDRTSMEIPGRTNELVSAVLTANPNTIVVNQSGTPVEMPWLKECSTLVQAWYGGCELGNALADILFGDVVPSGRLPLSWPFRNEDNPAFLNFHTERGRVLYGEDVFVGYRFYEKSKKEVAFPFGHGLSYTQFKYDNFKVTTTEDKTLNISLKVTNTGKLTAKEVIQIYVSPLNPTIIRPVKELKAFAKTELKSNESSTVNFSLQLKDACSFFDEFANEWCLDAGRYLALAGGSSEDIRLSGEFSIAETIFWSGL